MQSLHVEALTSTRQRKSPWAGSGGFWPVAAVKLYVLATEERLERRMLRLDW